MWSLIKPFLDPKTQGKVTILGSDYQQELLKFIDADQLPAEYGGSCKVLLFGLWCLSMSRRQGACAVNGTGAKAGVSIHKLAAEKSALLDNKRSPCLLEYDPEIVSESMKSYQRRGRGWFLDVSVGLQTTSSLVCRTHG